MKGAIQINFFLLLLLLLLLLLIIIKQLTVKYLREMWGSSIAMLEH